MNRYKFKVVGAGQRYDLHLEGTDDKEVKARADAIAGKGRSAVMTVRTQGTLDEYLGDEFPGRVEKHTRGSVDGRR